MKNSIFAIKVDIRELREIIKVQHNDFEIKYFINLKEFSVSANIMGVFISPPRTFIPKNLRKSVLESIHFYVLSSYWVIYKVN